MHESGKKSENDVDDMEVPEDDIENVDEMLEGFPPKVGNTPVKYAKIVRDRIKKYLDPKNSIPEIYPEGGVTYITMAGLELMKGNLIISGVKTIFVQAGIEEDSIKDILKFFMGAFDVVAATMRIQAEEVRSVTTNDVLNSTKQVIIALQNIAAKKPEHLAILDIMKELFEMLVYMSNTQKIDRKKFKDYLIVFGRKLIINFVPKDFHQLFFSIISMITGLDTGKFDPAKDDNYDLSNIQRIEMFTKNILPIVFPELKSIITPEKIDILMTINDIFKANFLFIIRDKDKLEETTRRLMAALKSLDIIDDNVFRVLQFFQSTAFYIRAKDYDKMVESFIEFSIDDILQKDTALKLYRQAKKLLDFKSIDNTITGLGNSINKSFKNPDAFKVIMQKISDGSAGPKDLFKVVDQAGDGNGSISKTEFNLLATRLGTKMTDHRINEIFAKIKGKGAKSEKFELNEREFQKAMNYLQEKNILQTMQLMGITSEMLTAIFIALVILLILILTFIFVGIQSFAIGGTFGAVINSIFPVVGGVGLGKQSDNPKEKLADDSIENNVDKALDITQSENL